MESCAGDELLVLAALLSLFHDEDRVAGGDEGEGDHDECSSCKRVARAGKSPLLPRQRQRMRRGRNRGGGIARHELQSRLMSDIHVRGRAVDGGGVDEHSVRKHGVG